MKGENNPYTGTLEEYNENGNLVADGPYVEVTTK